MAENKIVSYDSEGKMALKAAKGDVLKEFEKVCPTDKSFERIKKDMHDIFDNLLHELEKSGRL